MTKLIITDIIEPIGIGPGTVKATNVNGQAVKIVVHHKQWDAFDAAGFAPGDAVEYTPSNRTWKRG